MVTTLTTQFEQTHTRIGIERIEAIKAHLDVRAKLHLDPTLISWGVDTILIGSYGRKTSIYPCHDVDVFVRLPLCPPMMTPEQVFTEVQRVLEAGYPGRATEQRRSMMVDGFPDDLSVDAVPAVPEGIRWKIPEADRKPAGERTIKDRWEETDPLHLADLTDVRHKASSVIGGQPSYLRTVRLIRQIREAQLGDSKPGGLYFELLTYWAFEGGAAAESYAELLAEVLDSIATRLQSGVTVTDPGMDQPYAPAPEASDLAAAGAIFRRLATDAQRALGLDECEAAAIWQRMLGQNDKVAGWCFPTPPGCDSSGARIAALPHKDRGSDVDRPFA